MISGSTGDPKQDRRGMHKDEQRNREGIEGTIRGNEDDGATNWCRGSHKQAQDCSHETEDDAEDDRAVGRHQSGG